MAEIMVGQATDMADGDHRVFALGELEVGVFRLVNGSSPTRIAVHTMAARCAKAGCSTGSRRSSCRTRQAAGCGSVGTGTWFVRGMAMNSTLRQDGTPEMLGCACARYLCAYRATRSMLRRRGSRPSATT